jgi:hypothetical protein
MSRAGKFIPGGSGKSGRRTGPIRAPDPDAPRSATGELPVPGGGAGPKKRTFGRGSSLIKPVAKNQRLPIAVMSGFVCCLLVSAGWYFLAYVPAIKRNEASQQQLAAEKAGEAQRAADAEKARIAAANAEAAAHGVLTVDSNPTGATVTMGDFKATTPAKFSDASPGPFTLVIKADGYDDYRQDVTITANKPTDLGVIQLIPKTGNLSLTSPQSNVTYTITGPNGYSHQGQLPDKLEKLPVGEYSVAVQLEDWKLPPVNVTIHDNDNAKHEIRFPYATLNVITVPPGATVREGHTIMGQTPVTLSNIKPQDLDISVDLPPYTLQRLSVHLPDFGNITKQITLQQGKDFVAASGIPMVWIPEGNYWVGKYLVRQGEFQSVAKYNPSNFRKPDRPVETVSWEQATDFCDKLTQFEKKAGKLPNGYHYALPTEAMWEVFSADADINQAAMSRTTTLSSTQDVGASEPNKYGLYDTLGNVWEWCSDNFDDKGDHTLRGGSWLSSPDNFPGADTRNAGGAKYADRFTGFRVTLIPN